MKLKLPSLLPHKKLRATTARRSLGMPDEMDYEEMAEPNMKLSRALLIVLVLHVVAVAGIVAFNTIKTRQGSSFPPPRPSGIADGTSSAKATDETAVASDAVAVKVDLAKPAHPLEKVVAKIGPKSDGAKPPPTSANAKTYIVAKGDNPAKIAKKLKISYDDLLALNHIDDPHNLQIGRKLILPPVKAVPKAKKSDG